jgi:hypothetical protein
MQVVGNENWLQPARHRLHAGKLLVDASWYLLREIGLRCFVKEASSGEAMR